MTITPIKRVSWLCRDHHIAGEGNGQAQVIFSNRSLMSYENLRAYLRLLKAKSDPMDVRIDWAVIDPESVSAVEHRQLAGLQIADAVASSLFYAVNVNRYGETEDKYARILLSTCYRHKDSIQGYGLKFWPEEFQKLKSANPQLAVFAEGV